MDKIPREGWRVEGRWRIKEDLGGSWRNTSGIVRGLKETRGAQVEGRGGLRRYKEYNNLYGGGGGDDKEITAKRKGH